MDFEVDALLIDEKRKLDKIIGAQNELAEMAIKANAELEQVNARLAGISHHYEQLAKRAEELKDEGEIQVQITDHIQSLISEEYYSLAFEYADIVNGDGRYKLISILNKKSWDQHDGACVVDEIRAAIEQYENPVADVDLPF